jgi:glucosamine--fructose-6-phosphate aminotransferase (isomerizing)
MHLLIVCKHSPDEIIGIKRGSPFVFAHDDKGGFYFASDKQALAGYAEKLDSPRRWRACASPWRLTIPSKQEASKSRKSLKSWILEAVATSKGDYKHFMLKEIFEQPAIIRRICKVKGRI